MSDAQSFNAGDRVQYHAIGKATEATKNSSTTGEVVDVLTESQEAGSAGVKVKASPDEPRYLIRNDNTGKETAYKGDAIVGTA